MAKAVLKVTGMKCSGCEKGVQDAANGVAGVLASKASFKEGTVDVEYDAAKASLDRIKQAIRAIDYGVE
jgi:copper chaperone